MQSPSPVVIATLSRLAESIWEPVQDLCLPMQQVNLIDIFCCSHPKGTIYHAYVWRDGAIKAFSSSLYLSSIAAFCKQQGLAVVTNDSQLQGELSSYGIDAALLREKAWVQE